MADLSQPTINRVRTLITRSLGLNSTIPPNDLDTLINVIAAELQQAETTALTALAACAELRSVLETPAENGLRDSCGQCCSPLDDHADWCPAGQALANTDLGKGWVSPDAAATMRTALEQFADEDAWDWIDELPAWNSEGMPWQIAQEALEDSVSDEEGE